MELVYYGEDDYCTTCLRLKVQEDIDHACEVGLLEKADNGKYQLTEKGRRWGEECKESGSAESTTVNPHSASASTFQKDTDDQ